MIDSPVFLVGAERSGTTLLRLMLSHHPLISFDNESEYLVDEITDDGTFPSRGRLIWHLERSRGFLLKKREIKPDLDFVDLANDIVAQAAKGRAVQVYGATVHRHFDRLLHIWPNARFIHLVRDGRDVALSTIPMGWAGNIYHGIKEWVEVEGLWSRLARRLPDDRHMTLSYESLIADPEDELTRICTFVGLDYDAAMLSYDRSSTYSKPAAGNSAKWKKLAPAIVTAAESRAAMWLQVNNYPLSGPVRSPGVLRKAYYHVHNKWVRMRFAQKRFSTRLWFEERVSRRIGTEAWRASVRKRMHEITNRHIK